MKKNLRKFLALSLSMAMLLSTMMVTTYADDNKTGSGNYDVTISNAPDTGVSIAGDVFHAYQIFTADDVTSYSVTADFRAFFTGTLTGGDGSNTSYNFDTYLDVIEDYEDDYTGEDDTVNTTAGTGLGEPSADEVKNYDTALNNYNQLAGAYMNSYENNMYALAIQIRAYLDDVGQHNGGTVVCMAHATASDANDSGYEYAVIEGLESGYYFIFDQESSLNGIGISASGAFVPLTTSSSENTTISVKQSIPTMTKQIFHDDQNAWDIVGDSQIGDVVKFLVISTLPTNIDKYIATKGSSTEDYENSDGEQTINEYTYILTDTMSDGLTYNSDLVIYMDEGITPMPTDYYTVETTDLTDTTATFEVTIDVIEFLTDYPSNMTLYTYYTATLNEKAVVASEYDLNTASLEYSTNYADATHIGTTESTVYHFTFALDVNKVDENGNGLAGARFGLFDEEGYAIPLTEGVTDTTTGVVSYYYDKSASGTVSDGGYITTKTVTLDDDAGTVTGKFTIYGLNDQTVYTLREVEAPDGYNTTDQFDFIFTVTYDSLGQEITHFTDGSAYVNTAQSGSTDDWSSTATIINRLRIYLPETGGIGTVIFQVGGGALMLGAAAMLLLNRRKKED